MVVPVLRAADEPGGFGAVDEADRAVVTQEQVVGDVADRRASGVRIPAYGQHELMLGRRQPHGAGLLLAPTEEAPETGAELEQPPVVVIGDGASTGHGRGRHREYRTTI